MKGPLTQQRDKLAALYRWKADNIVRFFENLGMTKEQKEKFLAEELAGAYMQGQLSPIWALDVPDTEEETK